MPIRPENRARYPENWPQITAWIKDVRAGGRCECDGRCGRPYDHLDRDERCRNMHGAPAYDTGSIVVLTTAHLDHTPENCDKANLMAMCQGCHLNYDREHHAKTSAATRRAEIEASTEPLFALPGAGEEGGVR